MSAPAEICDSCGKTITDEELETGAGISVLGRSYCPGCKGQAIRDISVEDLAAPMEPRVAAPPPAPAPPLPPKAEVPPGRPKAPAAPPTRSQGPAAARADRPRDPGLGETPKTILKPATRRVARVARPGPNPALLIGIGAAAALVVVGIVLLARGTEGSSRRDPPGSPESGSPSKGKPPSDPEAARRDRAEQAYLKVQLLTRQSGIPPQEILSAVDRAKAECAGTPFQAKLEELRAQAQRTQESSEAVRALEPMIAELRTAFLADTSFVRFGELTGKFQKAKEIAVSHMPERVPELNRLRQEYVERYEEKARPFVEEIEQAAQILSDERRYDDALAKIETFPRELRQSGAWKGLEQLKQKIERQRALFPSKK
jgi:hypothetical protein